MLPTREGKRFILAALLIAVAALNTGNNLIYLILSMMLSILAVSVVLLVLNTRGLRVVLLPASHLYAKTNASIHVRVLNTKRRLPSYSLKFEGTGGMRGGGLVGHVPASGEVTARLGVFFERRGRIGRGSITMESEFPFIFFVRKIKADVSGELLVYPEVRDVRLAFGPVSSSAAARRRSSREQGDELFSLREFADGDDVRRVNWKVSARAGTLMVKEFGLEDVKRMTVVLVNTGPGNSELFEKAVSQAASVCLMLIREGYYVRLITSREVVPFGAGPGQIMRLMDLLAVVGEESSWRQQSPTSGGGAGGGGGAYVFVLKDEGAKAPWTPTDGETRTIYASRV